MFGREKKQCKDCKRKFRKKDMIMTFPDATVPDFRCVKCNTRYHEELEENRKRFEKEQAEKKINDKINTIVESYEESYGAKNEQLSKLYEKRQEILSIYNRAFDDYEEKEYRMEAKMGVHQLHSLTTYYKKERLWENTVEKAEKKYKKSLKEINLKMLDELELILNKKFCRECCTLHSGSCENS